MKLTDNELRDITKHLEAGKPLPDKYRFLLFEDKREVELVWNGKTSEVCNIVLPFQTIEQVDEPRAEKPSDTALQSDLFATDSRGRQLKGWTNKLIWGDNKLILSSLKTRPPRPIRRKTGPVVISADAIQSFTASTGHAFRPRTTGTTAPWLSWSVLERRT